MLSSSVGDLCVLEGVDGWTGKSVHALIVRVQQRKQLVPSDF